MVQNKFSYYRKYKQYTLEKRSLSSFAAQTHPFTFHGEIPIAQAFLLPRDCPEQAPLNPTIMWAQVVGSNKPIIECGLLCNGEQIYRPGMLDTGTDVTIIACSKWPVNWELQPVADVISGIGGATASMRSKRNVIVKGPEGKLTTIWPFVVRAPITLWGRDLLTQLGASLHIPSKD